MVIKKRILSLDIGTKRIGVAVSDAMYFGATPVKTISRINDKKALDEVEELLKLYSTDTLLIGIPYNMDGTLGQQAKNCLDFIEPIKDKYNIIYEDERLSSNEAEDILKKRNKKYTRNKGMVDMVAACVILEDYLKTLDK